ncbi:MAG TPA: hypothetical protein VI434_06090 [Candidatus Dormibacteraeota bacterium]
MSSRKGLVASRRWFLLGATAGAVAATAFAWIALPYFSAVLVTVVAFATTTAIGAGYRRSEEAPGDAAPRPRVRWSKRASILCIAIGTLALPLGGWTLFVPGDFSTGDYSALETSRTGMFILLAGILFLIIGVAKWPRGEQSPDPPPLAGDPTVPLERALPQMAPRAMSVGWFAVTVLTTVIGFLVGIYTAFDPGVAGNDPLPAGIFGAFFSLLLALGAWWFVGRKKLLT